jgi:hypothetical protein
MNSIVEIARQALIAGYLTLEAEDKLRQLLSTKYDREDFRAFIRLQQEAMAGRVKQESRELLESRASFQNQCSQIETSPLFKGS